LVTSELFEIRERNAVRAVKDIRRLSLLWLARSIDILPDNRNTFIILVQEFLELSPEHLLDEKSNDAPWLNIFDVLCLPYAQKNSPSELTDQEREEIEFVSRGMAFISYGQPPSFLTFDIIALSNVTYESPLLLYNHTLRLRKAWIHAKGDMDRMLRLAVKYFWRWPLQIIRVVLLIIIQETTFRFTDLSTSSIEEYLWVDLENIGNAEPLPLDILRLIHTILEQCTANAPLEYYRRYGPWLAALTQQLSAHLFKATLSEDWVSLSFIEEEALELLDLMMRLPAWKYSLDQSIDHIIYAIGLRKFQFYRPPEIHETRLIALAFQFNYDDLEDWWIEALICFDRMIQRSAHNPQLIHRIIMDILCRIDMSTLQATVIPADKIARLQNIQDPSLRRVASLFGLSLDLAHSALPLPRHLMHNSA